MKKFDIKTVAMTRFVAKDYIYFNSREENRVRETLPIIHNIALQYAMKNVTGKRGYRMHELVPTYVADFEKARHLFYVYPAIPALSVSRNLRVSKRLQATAVNVLFGWQSDSYRTFSEQTSRNLLQYTGVKLLEPGNEFITFISSNLDFDELQEVVPRYARLGKLMSTVEIKLVECAFNEWHGKGGESVSWYVNPLDIDPSLEIGKDYISSLLRMNPCDLLHHVTFIAGGSPFLSVTTPEGKTITLPACHHFQALPEEEDAS